MLGQEGKGGSQRGKGGREGKRREEKLYTLTEFEGGKGRRKGERRNCIH